MSVDDVSAPVAPPAPTAPATRRRVGSAGRLLEAVRATDPALLDELALQLRADPAHLDECRTGARPMELALQMQLAALVVALAPRHARAAHRLYAQAQAALRVEAALDTTHQIYPKEYLR